MLSKLRILFHFLYEGILLGQSHVAHRAWENRPKLLQKHLNWIAKNSPSYAGFAGLPLEKWPKTDKANHVATFNEINTIHAKWDECIDLALRAEKERDFSATLPGNIAVGLSSGTSGHRGVFLASPHERERWAGVILKRLLGSLWPRPKIAFVFRANSKLYESVSSKWIRFAFFDAFSPWRQILKSLDLYKPNVLIAPANLLGQLALAKSEGKLHIQPKAIFSVAEVLEEDKRIYLENVFEVPVGQVYQCTEGLLASTCQHGHLHLHEEHLWIEKDWIDPKVGSFVPIITDLRRQSQPIVRYRLNDILVLGSCDCGRRGTALARIEGREDDLLSFFNTQGENHIVYADFIRKMVLESTKNLMEWRCEQQVNGALLFFHKGADPDFEENLTRAWRTYCKQHDLICPDPQYALWTELSPREKFRRIRAYGKKEKS